MAKAKATSTKKGRGSKLQEQDALSRLGDAANILGGATMEELSEQMLAIGNAMDRILHDGPFRKRVVLGLIVDAMPSNRGKKIIGIRDLETVLETIANINEYLLKGDDE